ncbi:MAG: hypothetical protein KDL10_11780, partial [Kiritimatiellae bacterium]|nr:hypothetical protein [Kiritimatiellia bacterium]
MKTMLDAFLDDLTRGLYAQTQTGTYVPTLVIGLGGTGLKVLRHLKKALNRHQSQEIRLLGIETDDSENNKYPAIPPLEPKELVVLDAEAAIRTLARAEDGDASAQHVLEYLPVTHDLIGAVHQSVRGKIQLRKGAGQLRRAGKLLFCSNVADGVNLDNIFLDLRRELTGLGTMLAKRTAGIEIERGTRVYVVCSLAGGTGAGCLVDVLGLVRKHFGGTTDVVTAVCLLPGKALDAELTDPRDEKVNTRGNTIGVLKELQGFMLGQFGRYTFRFDAHTEMDLGNKNLLNCVYLVGDTQWNGTPVERWFDLCQAASYFLYGTLGTGVGAAKEAGAVNHDVSDQARMKARPSLYNTMGVGVVEYPIDEIGAFAFRSIVHSLLDRWLDP